ncbi:MAG: LysR family transcriptional regulator [Paracoccaceae bacterium]
MAKRDGEAMDSLDDMILFAEVAEAGSFTRGGLRLGLPKSTVSQRIAMLESRLGLRLLNRSTRQVTLTTAGQVYLDHCRRLRDVATAATEAMGHLKARPEGHLRLTCPEITASHFMPAFLRDFSRAHPGITLDLMATNRPLDLVRERMDFAFRVGPAQGQEMILRRISEIPRLLVAAPRYLENAPPLGTPGDLLHHRCLIHDGHPDWRFTDGAGIAPPAALRSDAMGFLLQAAVLGAGIALLPAYVCRSARAAGELVALLPGHVPRPYEMAMIFPSRENPSRAQLAFRAHVAGYDFAPLTGLEPGPPGDPPVRA